MGHNYLAELFRTFYLTWRKQYLKLGVFISLIKKVHTCMLMIWVELILICGFMNPKMLVIMPIDYV